MTLGRFLVALGLGLTLMSATDALAQPYPNRLIKIIAPFPAGGNVDVIARSLGEQLSKSLGQPVIIENRPGAGGNIGGDVVAKSPPDGYTLMMTSPGIQSINQFLYKKMPFDPETAFETISQIADMPMLVVVKGDAEFKSLKDLVDTAKERPGTLNFGSAGYGTTGHLGMELLAYTAGIKLRHVPYRGAAPVVVDLLAGRLDG